MSKSILVIDTPGNCALCQMGNINLHDMSKGGVYCKLNKKQKIPWENAKNGKPDWCPLKELPEKEDILDCLDNYDRGYYVGRNACIDEILKGANGNE